MRSTLLFASVLFTRLTPGDFLTEILFSRQRLRCRTRYKVKGRGFWWLGGLCLDAGCKIAVLMGIRRLCSSWICALIRHAMVPGSIASNMSVVFCDAMTQIG